MNNIEKKFQMLSAAPAVGILDLIKTVYANSVYGLYLRITIKKNNFSKENERKEKIKQENLFLL